MFDDFTRRTKENEILRRLVQLERRHDDLVLPEKSPDLVSPFLALPMLRGLWVASVDSGGDWYDVSGHGHHLTYNGDPVFGYDGLVPYWDLDGTGDYFSRADEADLDITGVEAYVAAAAMGLTMGGWFYPDSVVANTFNGVMTKIDIAGNQMSYWINGYDAASRVYGGMSSLGTAASSVQVFAGAPAAGDWHFWVLRFIPSTELAFFDTGTWHRVAAGIPASIHSGTADFYIGQRTAAGTEWAGRAAICFLCAAACSDAQISSAFNQTKAAFRV
jgi:hypothetical protein